MRWLPGVAVATLLASCIVIQVPAEGPAAPSGGGAASPPSTQPPSPTTSSPGSGGRRLVEQMVDAVNAHRRSIRCPELVWMQTVANAAQGHSDDMSRRNYFNHQSPEGLGPADRLRAHGVTYRSMGENIAQHPGTPRDVLAGWLASPGHRQNLERCTYTHHGIGLRDGFWVHMFITPLPPPVPAP